MTKGKMVKKIFAVIGIVVGAVLAFAGAMVGVMAAMGKFKEPVVYPETLVFEQSVLMIDQNNPAITLTSGKKIYSFVLTGKSSEEYAVNKKLCYLSFSKGKDIITLCSKDGTPLTPSQSNGNQYLVNCNEPVYYFVNNRISEKASYFVSASILLGVLNLFPIKSFDGGRILESVLLMFISPKLVLRLVKLISFFCIITLWIVSVYFLLIYTYSLGLFVFSTSLFCNIFIDDSF